MKMLSRALRALAVLAFVLLTGCAAFPQHKVAPVQAVDLSRVAQKPSAYATVQFFRGKPGANPMELAPTALGMDKIHTMIRENVSGSGLFSKVSYDSTTKETSDLRLNVRVYNHADIGSAMVGGFITGLTLYVIPSKATDNFIVQVDVADKTGKALVQTANEDSMNFWQGWIFLPVAGKTPQKALDATVGNQVRAALKEAYDSGKLNAAYAPKGGAAVAGY